MVIVSKAVLGVDVFAEHSNFEGFRFLDFDLIDCGIPAGSILILRVKADAESLAIQFSIPDNQDGLVVSEEVKFHREFLEEYFDDAVELATSCLWCDHDTILEKVLVGVQPPVDLASAVCVPKRPR